MASFQDRVLTTIKRIPRGKVATYSQVARKIGKPGASRAVGNALHANPQPITVPCHRIILSDGRLGGYGMGAPKKKRLLESEGIEIVHGKIDLEKFQCRL